MTEERNCSTILRVRRLLLVLSGAFLAWAAVVAATGGIQWRIFGVIFRSRDSARALALGVVLLLIHATLFRQSFSHDTDRMAALLRRVLPGLALIGVLALTAHAVRYGSFTAGGADSWGYVSQAYGWARGVLPRAEPFPISVPWPSADASLAPLGYRPGPTAHTMVPTYAPGLPLLMAAALVFGACGPFLVVPACAGLLVWLTFVLGGRTGGPWASLLAAVLAATSPIVLFQSIWPMSDIPAATFWTGAVVSALGSTRGGAIGAGLWTAAGLLVRPNLPLLPLILLAHVMLSVPGRERWIRAVLFSAAVAPAAIALAVLNTLWYGAPWNSGYGAAGEIFSVSNIVPNLSRYPVWLWQSQSPIVLLAFAPLLPAFKRDAAQPAVRLCAAIFLGTLVSYLVYAPFEEWWYLRFLLPAIPALLVLIATAIVACGRRLPKPWGRIGVVAVTSALVVFTNSFNMTHGMFGELKAVERRYADVGAYLQRALPADAVVLAVQQSGSVRFYGGRMTIRWDLIDRDWSARAPAELERLGLHPYLVIEDPEVPQMRRWFGLDAGAPIPWPLVTRMQEHGGVSVFDLSSRAAASTPVALESGSTPHCSALQRMTIQP